jgi:hypothetical protein
MPTATSQHSKVIQPTPSTNAINSQRLYSSRQALDLIFQSVPAVWRVAVEPKHVGNI